MLADPIFNISSYSLNKKECTDVIYYWKKKNKHPQKTLNQKVRRNSIVNFEIMYMVYFSVMNQKYTIGRKIVLMTIQI